MNKRERLEKTLAGERPDRLPVALWRHWPGDDQRAADLAKSIITYQQQFDWDFAVAVPANNFSVTGYGLQDAWQGSTYGYREITKRVIRRSLDWTSLKTLDPMRGDLAKQIECLRILGETFQNEQVPFIQLVYSPFAQALRLAGQDVLMTHLRQEPARLQTGLNILTDSTLRFIEALRRTPVDGIVYVIEGATYTLLAEQEYRAFGTPYDQKILESLAPEWWLNVAQVSGQSPMLNLVSQYHVPIISWCNQEIAAYTLETARTLFRGTLCSGLGDYHELHDDTPTTIRTLARQALNQADRRFILSGGGVVPITAPISNLRTVRNVVKM